MNSKGNFDTMDIFVYLWQKRKIITIVTVLGAIISIVVSLLIPNYCKSQSTNVFTRTLLDDPKLQFT